MSDFFARLKIMQTKDAAYFAADLFWESLRVPFPVPREQSGLPIPTPPHAWHQYVALYKDADNSIRTVGFCNWIRYGDMYLEGGMCVDKRFYRTLPRDEWRDCRDAGGVAQLMMEAAALELNDASAWFGYCGDKQALLVDQRADYVATRHRHLIVKWFKELTARQQDDLVEAAARIGPF
jgi:hypothetical protein